ncbi:type II toxin-antitoxin system VapC family toxin [Verrucomicrobiota bacterium]
MKTVYIETTVLSFYYDDRAESLYRRKITRDWWRTQRRNYDVFISYFVLQEVRNPVYPGWQKVSALAQRLRLLEIAPDIEGIVGVYMENQLMPKEDIGDAAHLAVASYHSVDYLLTWNCKHLANANKIEHIRSINRRLGLLTPEIVTPEQLYWG